MARHTHSQTVRSRAARLLPGRKERREHALGSYLRPLRSGIGQQHTDADVVEDANNVEEATALAAVPGNLLHDRRVRRLQFEYCQ